MDDLLNTFTETRECDYKGEHYSVRDNGAVMRHPKPGKKARPNDNVWTFGTRDEKTAYMKFGTHRVHIIVANAFLGEHDSKVYVVDHKDTNRCNNRVSNLRWFTRLENALNNPITRKRIEWLCGGDIQKFLDDPSCLRTDDPKAQDLSWMRTVTSEEAKTAMSNLMRWAKKPLSTAAGGGANGQEKKHDPEWMFKKHQWNQPEPRHYGSLQHIEYCLGVAQECVSPKWATQFNWDPPTSFPLCPTEFSDTAIDEYYASLSKGTVFSENECGHSTILDFRKDSHHGGFVVLLQTNDQRPYAVIRVAVEAGTIAHINHAGIFAKLEDAQSRFENELKWPNDDDVITVKAGCEKTKRHDKTAEGKEVEYLQEPQTSDRISLDEYFSRLTPGAPFAKTKYGISSVIQAKMAKDGSSFGVAVTFPSELKHYAAYKVFVVKNFYIHQFLHTCFEENGALQRMTEAAGETWTGPDSIDNYC